VSSSTGVLSVRILEAIVHSAGRAALFVIASGAKQSSLSFGLWIASSLRSSQ
jgi:hypothetical protein